MAVTLGANFDTVASAGNANYSRRVGARQYRDEETSTTAVDTYTNFGVNFEDSYFSYACPRIGHATDNVTVTLNDGTITFENGLTEFDSFTSSLNIGGAIAGCTFNHNRMTFLATNGAVNGYGLVFGTVTGVNRSTLNWDDVHFVGLNDSSWFVNVEGSNPNSSFNNIQFTQGFFNSPQNVPLQGFVFDGTVRDNTGTNAYTFRVSWQAANTDVWTLYEGFQFNGTGTLADGSTAGSSTTSGGVTTPARGYDGLRNGQPAHINFPTAVNSDRTREVFLLNFRMETDDIIAAVRNGFTANRNYLITSAYSWNPSFIDDITGDEIDDIKVVGLPTYWVPPSTAMDTSTAPGATDTSGDPVTGVPHRNTTGFMSTNEPIWIEVDRVDMNAARINRPIDRALDENGEFDSALDTTFRPKSFSHNYSGQVNIEVDRFTLSGGLTSTISYDRSAVYAGAVDEIAVGFTATTAAALTGDTNNTYDNIYRRLKAYWFNDNTDDLGAWNSIDNATLSAGVMAFNRDTTFSPTATDISITASEIVIPSTIALSGAGEFIHTIEVDGDITLPDLTISSNITATNIEFSTARPTVLISDGTIEGNMDLIAGDFEITGGDVSGLTLSLATGTANVRLGPGVTGVPTRNATSGATINFTFDTIFTSDITGDITVRLSDGTFLHALNVSTNTWDSNSIPAGTHTAMISTEGFIGNPVEFTVVDLTESTVNLTAIDLSQVGYPSSTPLTGRGTQTFDKVTYESRDTLRLTQSGGDFDYETTEGLRLFGDMAGATVGGTNNIFNEVTLSNYTEMQTARTAGTFSDNSIFSLNADGVVRVNMPVVRLRVQSPDGPWELFANTTAAVTVDADYELFEGYTGTATISGSASATPPTGIQASSLDAAADDIVNRVNINTDAEAAQLEIDLDRIENRVENVARAQEGG